MGPISGLLILAFTSFLLGGFLVLTKATGILLMLAIIGILSVLCVMSPGILASTFPLLITILPILVAITILVLLLGFGILGGTVSINYIGVLAGLVVMACSLAIF
jgi:hypothetical protein